MRRLAAVLVLACLAGCAMSVDEIRSQGPRTEHALQLEPSQASACLSRNADNFGDNLTSIIRPLPRPNAFEVVVRMHVDAIYTLFVMDVAPAPSGSRMTMWAYPRMIESRQEDFRRDVVKGC